MIILKRATPETTSFLSHVAILGADKNEIVPPEFTVLQHTMTSNDANLNLGAKGKRTYLCVRYMKHGLRVTSLSMVSQHQKEAPHDSFRLRSTVGGGDATLGEKSKDPYHLCFSKDWASLMLTPSCLRVRESKESKESVAVDAVPVAVDAVPVNADTIPVNADTIPVNADAIPVNADAIPVNADAIPVNADTIPVNADTIPVNVDTIPVNADTTSITSPDTIPITPSNTPVTPSNEVPEVTDDMMASIPLSPIPEAPQDGAAEPMPDDLDMSVIPVEEPPLDTAALKQAAASYREITRSLLPLLIGCHCGDPAITRICAEHLHHFLYSRVVATASGLADPCMDVILDCVYEGVLATLLSSAFEVQNLLMKIVGYFTIIAQPTLVRVMHIFSALTHYLLRLQENGAVNTQHYDQMYKGLRTIASLVTARTKVETSAVKTELSHKVMDEVLAAYAYKLESPGALMAGEMTEDMLNVCEKLHCDLYDQNMTLFLLSILGDLRRYGQVVVFGGGDA